MKTNSLYRADIDGLRALAVVAIMIYHFNSSLIPGGFTAIELFFVLSGYLITRNICLEIDRGTFSLSNFYVKRMRRIAPAFMAMTAVTLIAGSFLLLPKDMTRLGISAVFATLSLSNVYFGSWLDTGYFAASSAEEPLLHTWSLGIEEQFYLLWPAALAAMALKRNHMRWTIGFATLVCLGAFVCGTITSETAPNFAYYMLPSRAAELMLGVLLALIRHRDQKLPPVEQPPLTMLQKAGIEVMGLSGFALIAFAMLSFKSSDPYPGIKAFVPCAGTLLVMQAGEWRSRIVHTLLASKPVVFIGLISYPLYLWHWPLLAFIRYFYGQVTLIHSLVAVPFILVMSVLTYYYIEQPIQKSRPLPARKTVAWYVGATVVLLVLAGGALWKNSSDSGTGLAMKLDEETQAAYSFSYNCQYSNFEPNFLTDNRCVIRPAEMANPLEADILLWGDSHAAHYIGIVGAVAKSGGAGFRNASHSACAPVFVSGYGNGPYKPGCEKFWPEIRKAILQGTYKTIIIGSAWGYYWNTPNFRQDFEKTIVEIRETGAHVVILGQVPEFLDYNRACESRSQRIGISNCKERQSYPDPGDTGVNQYLSGLAAVSSNVTYLDVRDFICKDGTCSPYLSDRPIYFDAGHLSMLGSWRIGEELMTSPAGARWLSTISRRQISADSGNSVPVFH